jgi:hypothetical protein
MSAASPASDHHKVLMVGGGTAGGLRRTGGLPDGRGDS